MRKRWAEYFEFVLNVEVVREANRNVVIDRRMPVFGELNERAVSIEEGREAVNEMKLLKVPGMDEFPVECFKKDGMAVLEWLIKTVERISSDMEVPN